ncbi:MAG: PD40 domain-containing protein [Alloprevotella sp.]|nr:PD40 domain-containing protein [Alloprevotella sp.]
MKRLSLYILTAVCMAAFTACSKTPEIPANSTPVKEQAEIYPDYRDIVIPPNIAPLNFQVRSEGTDFVCALEGAGQSLVAGAGKDGKVMFDTLQWKQLLQAAKGKDLTVRLYAKCGDAWVSFPAYTLTVAAEPIDRYLSYRLIEPSYELYRQMGLYQRDLENFDEYVIYENNREFDDTQNHCVNCHNFQGYDTQRMLFHVRAKHGGTIMVDGDKVEKLKMTTDSTAGNAVYPSWHPTLPLIAFSTNKTGQAFHLQHPNKIEVVDYGSDLLFYDVENHTISNILKSDDTFETFPCWAPDGSALYYCSAYMPMFRGLPDSVAVDTIMRYHPVARYDIKRLSFDAATRTFGAPEMVVDCASEKMSASVPRISPDGRYLLYARGAFGQFHIWHHDSDLWIKDLQTGDNYALTEANSPGVDSYHGWSSNGRWIVFASRRMDGNYSRPFIAYFDKEGHAHKAFVLPQEDPEHNLMLMKSYNVPEFSRSRVRFTPQQFHDVIYNDDALKPVSYKAL